MRVVLENHLRYMLSILRDCTEAGWILDPVETEDWVLISLSVSFKLLSIISNKKLSSEIL